MCLASGGCLPGEFPCANGGCIDLWWRCDHDNDCLDGSDEIDCVYPECQADQFRCAGSGRCISARWRCDGERDCRDASDETGCNEYLSAENLTRIDPDSFSLGNKVSAEDVDVDTSPAQTAVFESHSAKDIRPMKAKTVHSEEDSNTDDVIRDNQEGGKLPDQTEHARVDPEDQQLPFVELTVGG
ncbi:PREDICTED: low-density lipoprotein receptor-related protein 1B-like [Branchiostoma belcheri]|uniref:Low-density lipoprotein receptor-related protein 1B-like n=1 Tax=Branchiostoma belcheri TaxID=7741 RepID=A0A6P4YFS7_BRABE|nr:PREDICTED: low-density lipoprotein receptor-related protein 1B-like [Branchiostoma belcheri]